MTDYKFKFKREWIDLGWALRPKIKVTLSANGKSKQIIAIIDTGSDLVYIPKDMADYFGLSLSKNELTGQGAETEFSYRTSQIRVSLENPHKIFRKLVEVMVPAKGADHKDVILGTGFLENFIVTLDYKNEKINLRAHQ